MKLIPEFLRLNAGENLSRRLTVTAEEALWGKTCVLSFVTPMGKLFISDKLTLSGGQGEYVIPKVLLDGKGVLFCQMCFTGDDGFVIKSEIYEFPVYAACDMEGFPEADGESVKNLSEILRLIDNKSDVGHIHDGRYYTKNETDGLFAENFGSSHNHNDIYYTQAETESLLSGKSDVKHTHDSQYASLEQIGELSQVQQNHTQLLGAVADYVVEEGTTGGWTYRKWNSGVAECWCKKTVVFDENEKVSAGFSDTNGNPFYIVRYTLSHPITFSAPPCSTGSCAWKNTEWVQVDASLSGTLIRLFGNSNSIKTVCSGGIAISIQLKGKWK